MTALAENAPFQVVGPAGAYFRVMNGNLAKIPESTRMVLQRDIEGSPLAWALALVLAGWRRLEGGGELPSEFASAGADKLVAQVKQFSSAFPKSFVSFLEAADRGEEAAAGSYFQSALTDLPSYARPVLNNWLSSQGFVDVSRKLVGAIGGAPKQPPGKKPAVNQYTINPGKPSKADKTAILAGRLAKAGWTQQEIDRILMGPDKAHLTAERVYRQIAASKPSVQADVQAQLGPPATEMDDLGHVEDHHLTGSMPRVTSAEDLLGEYKALPPEQQQRLLLLLQQKPVQKSEVAPKGNEPAGGTRGTSGSSSPSKTATTSDTGKIADAVKSGIDLARETINRILKTTESSNSDGGSKRGGVQPSNGGKDSGASADERDVPDVGSDDDAPENDTEGGSSDSDEGVGPGKDEGEGSPAGDDSSASVPPDYINDSADVVD